MLRAVLNIGKDKKIYNGLGVKVEDLQGKLFLRYDPQSDIFTIAYSELGVIVANIDMSVEEFSDVTSAMVKMVKDYNLKKAQEYMARMKDGKTEISTGINGVPSSRLTDRSGEDKPKKPKGD